MLAIHEDIKSDIDFALILSVFDKVVEHFKLPGSVRVDLSIVDEETIRELNRQQRDVDAVTDVLSFPLRQKTIRMTSIPRAERYCLAISCFVIKGRCSRAWSTDIPKKERAVILCCTDFCICWDTTI